MRLAFIFCFIVHSGFCQSVIELKDLYRIFNSSHTEAESELRAKGFSLLNLDKHGQITGQAVVYADMKAGWINEKKEQVLWEYRLNSPVINVGLSQPNDLKILSEAAMCDPKLDTAAMMKGIREMALKKFQTRTADIIFTNEDRSFFVGFTPPVNDRYTCIYFVRKGDIHYDLLLRLYGGINKIKKP